MNTLNIRAPDIEALVNNYMYKRIDSELYIQNKTDNNIYNNLHPTMMTCKTLYWDYFSLRRGRRFG